MLAAGMIEWNFRSVIRLFRLFKDKILWNQITTNCSNMSCIVQAIKINV